MRKANEAFTERRVRFAGREFVVLQESSVMTGNDVNTMMCICTCIVHKVVFDVDGPYSMQ